MIPWFRRAIGSGLLLAGVLAQDLWALNLDPYWALEDGDYQKWVEVRCDAGERDACRDLCGSANQCDVPEDLCKNCVGTDIYITNLFREMGRTYTNSGEEASTAEIAELLGSGGFQTINSQSILNHVEPYDSLRLQKQFSSLCWDVDGGEDIYPEGPVVVLEKDLDSGKLLAAQYVVCSGKGYYIRSDADVIFPEDI